MLARASCLPTQNNHPAACRTVCETGRMPALRLERKAPKTYHAAKTRQADSQPASPRWPGYTARPGLRG